MSTKSSQLTFGLLGLGRFGKHHARLLESAAEVTLAAIAANASESQKIIANPNINCVVIASPPASHAKLARAALGAGKHVLVEKPMAQNMKEAVALAREVKKSGRVFMVGHQYLFNDYIGHLKTVLESGELGSIRYALAEQMSFGPLRSEGDCFLECATHEFAILDYLLGPIHIASASGRSAAFSKSKKKRDFAVATLALQSRMLATVVVSLYAPEKRRCLTVAGEKGFAVFDDTKPEKKLKIVLHRYPQKKFRSSSIFLPHGPYRQITPDIKAREPLKNQLNHFIQCVKTGARPRTDIGHGLRVTKLLSGVSKTIKHV